MKDIPFAALKLTMYEASLKAYRRLTHKDDMASLTAMEVAFLGVVSGAATGVITTPLDVVNTRLKSAAHVGASNSFMSVSRTILLEGGIAAFFAGLGPRVALFSVGSGLFWAAYERTRMLVVL